MNLTAVYDPATAAVVVNVWPNTSEEPTITRIDVNGRRAVRKPGNLYAKNSTHGWVAHDREHATGGPVRYLATVPGGDSGVIDADMTGAPLHPVLTTPTTTWPDIAVLQVAGLEGTRTASSVLHNVIGVAAPVVTFDVSSTRAGTLSLLCAGHDRALEVAGRVASTAVTLLRQREHPGLDMYFVTTGSTVRPAAPGTRYWTVEMPYIEVDAPAGNAVTAPAWSWQRVADVYGTHNDVLTSYLTFDHLTRRDAV